MAKRIYREGVALSELQGLEIASKHGRFSVTAKCTTCGAVDTRTATSAEPPRVAAAKMEQRGWRLGKHMACAACQQAEKDAARAAKVAKAFPMPAVLPSVIVDPPFAMAATPAPFVIEADGGPCVTTAESDAALDVARTPLPNGNVLAEIMCDHCAKVGKLEFPGAGAQSTVARRFRLEGWKIGIGGTYCPDHRTRADRLPSLPLPTIEAKPETPAMTDSLPIATVTVPASTLAAKAAKRAAYELLDANFDVATGAFSAGWTDERIAHESKLALPAVKTLREEMFGELKVPPALDTLRAEVTAARQKAMMAEGNAKLAADECRTAVEACRALETRLAALVKANGWRE